MDEGRGARRLTLGNSLQECSEYEGEIIAWVETVPERTGGEGCETGPEAWLLAFRRDAEIHVVSQPVVSVHVPVLEVSSRVLSCFDAPWIDILQPVPVYFACLRVYAFEAHA